MNRFTTTMMISALGLASQLADAAPPQDPPAVIVRFADLDLSHGQGITVLYQRLKAAAEAVCAALNSRDLGSQTRYKMCWQDAPATT
ncbi:MAG TPA: UrcA family protein [Steroidobacteraceae bacterium]|jgi:UrcA family protein|nr:UrcA family protein [Steroidobacteraceae bacterium]